MKLTQEEKNLIEIDNQHWIDLDVSLQRLLQNPDFKKVILDGFMADRALEDMCYRFNPYPANHDDLVRLYKKVL